MSLERKIRCNLCGTGSQRLLYCLDQLEVLQCAHCGLIFTDLVERPEEIAKDYSRDYFKERDEYYFRNTVEDPLRGVENSSILDFKQWLKRIESYKPAGKILDVGCATGVFLALARERGWEPYGVDISGFAVGHAQKRFGIEGFVGNITAANFPDNYFDVITLLDVVEHFSNPVEQLIEVRRILKHDGIVLLNTPNEKSLMKILAHGIYTITLGRIQYPVKKLYHRYHLYYFSPKTFQQTLEKSGFEVIELTKKTIPLVKARGLRVEKIMVKGLSFLEKIFHCEYELICIARKRQKNSGS